MRRLGQFALGCALLLTANLAAAVSCQMGSLASYLALDGTGCDIGTVHFFDFALLQSPTGALPFANLTLTPVAQSGEAGFDFGVDARASSGSLLEQLVGYRVTGMGSSLIGATLFFTGSATTGDAAVTAVENLCLAGVFAASNGVAGCTGTPLDLAVVDIFGSADPPMSAAFAAIPALAVVTDIGVDGGTDGAGSLTSASTRFRFVPAAITVPEPSALLLLFVALVAFQVMRPTQTARQR